MIETGTILSGSDQVQDCADASMIGAGTEAAPGVVSGIETGVEIGGLAIAIIVIAHATGAESASWTGNASVRESELGSERSENATEKGQESESGKGSVSGIETGTEIATEIGTVDVTS